MSETKYKVLLVDDDKEVLQINGAFLKTKGYEVALANNGVAALELLRENEFHCVVLDVMMPEMNGYQVLEELRTFSQVPVLLLTGKTAEEDRIMGLMSGADDYVTKPCSLEEMALRIQIHIRRSWKEAKNESVLEFPPLRLELLEHKAFCGDVELLLSNKEYDMLVLFAQNPGKELTFEQIGNKLYQGYLESDRKNIMVTASRLRKKMEGNVGLENMIETVWGKGYRFKG